MGASLWMTSGQVEDINPGNTLVSAPSTTGTIVISGSGPDAGARIKIFEPGTISLLGFHITANTGTATATATLMLNDVATDLEVAGSAAGYYVNDMDVVPVVAGDIIHVRWVHSNVFEPTIEVNGGSLLFTPDDSSLCITQTGTELYSGFAGINAGATRYLALHGVHGEGSTTQEERQDCIPINCTAKNTRIYITTNNANGPAVITLQLDGADTDVSITVAAGQTGFFENSTDEFDVSAHQKVGWKVDLTGAGSGGITFVTAFAQFHSFNGEFFLGLGQQARTPPGTTTDLAISGENWNLDTEAEQQWQATLAGFVLGLCINIRVNNATSESFLRFRANSINGNNVVEIPAGGTGFFDGAASDAWVIDDLLSLRLTIPGGGEVTYSTMDVGFSFQLGRGVIGPYAWVEARRRIP